MKHVVQRLRNGRIEVIDVPIPEVSSNGVLIDVRASLLSAGTERTKVETGKQSLIGKARSRPDQVRQVLDKAQRDGVRETVLAVRSRLDAPSSLGYSAAGVVLEVGDRVRDLLPGDRVACAGADFAVHAEVDHVPSNLCVKLPDAIDFASGAFTTVASIALHGVRQADVRLGERVAVIGLGLVGQIAAQLLHVSGCHVVGIDLAESLVERAANSGVADVAYTRQQLDPGNLPVAAANCDAVLITAATKSSDPIELAAQLCRDRARVVVVGDVGLEIPRAPYYDKELELRLSRSYGPGRYDREYEARGLDYPIGYVRWTERRNMGAVTELLAQGKLDFTGLITEKLPVDRAPEAYERLLTTTPSPLALILEYEPTAPRPPAPRSKVTPAVRTGDKLGLVGAGNFAQGTLIPAAVAAGFELAAVASATGRSAEAARERFGFQRTGTAESVITGDDTDLVVVATRHSSHAPLAGSALASGKSVFLEKPPCLTQVELSGLRAGLADAPGELFVGFNRRHAPLAEALRSHMADRAPIELLYRVNAGLLPANHWLNDPEDGGGRLLGEGCHFIDFACWLVDALPCRVACSMRAAPDTSLAAAQSFSVLLDFPEGSSATILYGAAGASGLAKEYVEVHGGGRSAVLDDFRSLVSYDGRKSSKRRGRGQDKGHRMMMQRVRDSLASGVPLRSPSPLDSMAVTFAALRAAETGQSIDPLAAASTARSPEASVRL